MRQPGESAIIKHAMYDFTSNYNDATITGTVYWNGLPVIDDDDGGTAGVREPRRPIQPLAPAAMAMEIEPEFCFA